MTVRPISCGEPTSVAQDEPGPVQAGRDMHGGAAEQAEPVVR